MFDLIASLLAYFYSIAGSYGVAILMLTFLIMLVFTPLIFKSTKSMMAMREIQPKIKKLQAKHKDDREKLNQETMALYQKHGVNPVGGCLPLFFQAPVFLVLFRVLNGLTRREVDTGFAMGNAMTKQGIAIDTSNTDIPLSISDPANGNCSPLRCFNPEYLEPTSELSTDLRATNEMTSWGIDLSRSASETLGGSITSSIPYFLLVIVIGILSWWQHHQIQGRSAGGDINPQMQAITKIMPWFLPIFSFTMPAALCVYFIGQSVVRVGQQAFIGRKFYGDNAPSFVDGEMDDDDDDDDDLDDSDSASAAPAGGLLGSLMGGNQASSGASASSRHGSRAPVSATSKPRNRTRPPVSTSSSNGSKAKSGGSKAGKATESMADESSGMWAKAKRRASDLGGETSTASQSTTKTSRSKKASNGSSAASSSKPSKRVTPKGSTSRSSGTKRK